MKHPQTLVAIALLVLALAALVYLLLRPGLSPYMAVDELVAEADRFRETPMRLAGFLAGPAERGPDGTTTFRVETRGASLPVLCSDGFPPDLEPGREILLDGRLGRDGVFRAHRLLTQCASRYSDRLQENPDGRLE